MKRILCNWLPNWPIQRLVVAQPELKGQAILLHTRVGSRGQRVAVCSRKAQACGVRVGMPLAEAKTLGEKGHLPHAATLHVAEYDPRVDRAALLQLAEWCEQFSPVVSLDEETSLHPKCLSAGYASPETLLLEVAGLGSWFGGEDRLAQHIVTAFQQRGYFVQLALADTVGAAWAQAHFGLRMVDGGWGMGEKENPPSAIHHPQYKVLPGNEGLTALHPLPVESLRLPKETVELLHQLGVFQVHQLLKLPRSSLTSRLGKSVLHRLDQANGQIEEVLVAHRPSPAFDVQWSLEHPTEQQRLIKQGLQHLMERLTRELVQRDRGAMQLEVCLGLRIADCELAIDSQIQPFSSAHPPATIRHPPSKRFCLRLDLFRPMADPQHLLDLVLMQLERLRLPGPVHEVRVQAPLTARLERYQNELFADAARVQARELAMLVDRLSSRLGKESVLRPRLQAESQPERAVRFLPLTSRKVAKATQVISSHARRETPGANDRPLRLHHPPLSLNVLAVAPDGPPVRFCYQGRWYHVARHWGPERIETGWWRGRTIRRDYYRVETSTGTRFWLFRHLDNSQWFLHGTFE